MSEVVARLRRMQSLTIIGGSLAGEAADEIESLRQQLTPLGEFCETLKERIVGLENELNHEKAVSSRTEVVKSLSEQNESLRNQLAEALSACKTKDELIEKFRRAIGDHNAPNDCYATGPLTGNDFLDLVQCPACSALEAYEEALAATEPKA